MRTSYHDAGGGFDRAQGEMIWLMGLVFVLVVVHLLVESYKKASDILFTTICLAINENKAARPADAPPAAGQLQPKEPAAATLN